MTTYSNTFTAGAKKYLVNFANVYPVLTWGTGQILDIDEKTSFI